MDRAIKFRAWDKGWKEIVYPDIIYHNINLGITIHKAFRTSNGNSYFPLQENLTLMQFTGLYDCEGKEIYEGDIVTCTAISTTHIVIVEDIRYIPIEITGWKSAYNDFSCKVIGNLYEHPNLLNNESNT